MLPRTDSGFTYSTSLSILGIWNHKRTTVIQLIPRAQSWINNPLVDSPILINRLLNFRLVQATVIKSSQLRHPSDETNSLPILPVYTTKHTACRSNPTAPFELTFMLYLYISIIDYCISATPRSRMVHLSKNNFLFRADWKFNEYFVYWIILCKCRCSTICGSK